MTEVWDTPCTKCGRPSRRLYMTRHPGGLECSRCFAIRRNAAASRRRAINSLRQKDGDQ